ncbi:BTAD domain-containing putative transcriptional regulator [Nonomuraea sp. NPDC050643]|uniref:AfsR/SARP family transcriptional regulator n=1 Tax=Nonomuraea sp. NPDC050643 TaxID=3155660 RepID=UPI0033DECD22
MAGATFGILGPVRAHRADGREVALEGKQNAVLTVLLLNVNVPVSRERLIDALWETPPASAVANLQTHVARIRKTFTSDIRLFTKGPGYLLEAAPEEVDLLIFDRETRRARAEAKQGDLVAAVRRFERALELRRGRPAEGIQLYAWALARVAELEERLAETRLDRAEAMLGIGSYAEVIGDLRPFLTEQPLSERGWRLLMLAYARAGQRHRALEAYQQARARLVDELGIEPGEELRHLQAVILADALPAADAERRRTICQLPPDHADFVGRREELATVTRNLLSAHRHVPPTGAAVPISAVSGQGGVGKTTLAVHIAHRLRHEFPDGQLYIDLRGGEKHPLDATEALGRFLRALGLDSSAMPAELDQRVELYRERIADRRYLVVLDNAADEVRLRPLIPGTPGCAVLITSRHRLATLPATQRIDLDVLPVEDAVEMLGNIIGDDKTAEAPEDAHRLVQLCGRLPLAVRIAAAKLAARPHWSLGHLVSRLRDTRGRLGQLSHGSHEVRASIGIGYQGLAPLAQRMFCRLGLLEAPDFAAWVGAALLDTSEQVAEQLIEQLADVRLLEVAGHGPDGEVRFRFHDLTGAYARERAETEEEDGERAAALQRAFSGWLVMTQRAHAHLCGGDYRIISGNGIRWRPDARTAERVVRDPLAWIEAERAGIVAGVRQCASLRLDELCWDWAMSAMNLFETRSCHDEWRATHETALHSARMSGDIRGQAAMLNGLARLHFAQDDLTGCGRALEEALDLFDKAEDRHGHALALVNMAELHRLQGRNADALTCYEQAMDGLAQAGDRSTEITVMRGIGRIHFNQRRFELADTFIRRAIQLADDTGDVRSREFTRIVLGEIELARGDLAASEASLSRALEGLDALGFPSGIAYASLGLAEARLARHDLADAERLLQQALAVYRDTGDNVGQARVLFTRAELRRRQRRLDEAAAMLTEVVAICQAIPAPRRHGLALRALGDVRRDAGDLLAALAAWQRSLTILEATSSPEAIEVAALLELHRTEPH